jgi:hypothetical protein
MYKADSKFCFFTLHHTYVRTEVNYTEEVEDPVDSDGM